MLLPVVALTAAAAAAASSRSLTVAAQPEDHGRELVENVCTYCHNLDRLRDKELNREEWRGLIKGMLSEGPPVTDEEFSMILDYLVKHHGRKH